MFKRELNGLFAAAALIALTACGTDDAGQTAADQPATTTQQQIGANIELPEGVTLEMVQAGKTVFETTTCFTCHAMDASGTALAPSLRDQEWLNSGGTYPEIVEVVRNGVAQPVRYPAAMPPMGGGQLTEDQIRQVSAYVYAISHGG